MYTAHVKVGIFNNIFYTKLQYMKLHLKHLFMCLYFTRISEKLKFS